jgi:hypothetical protein
MASNSETVRSLTRGELDANSDCFDAQLLQLKLHDLERQLNLLLELPDERRDVEKTNSLGQLGLEAIRADAEITKLRAETTNLRREWRSERVRFWVPIVAPLVGSLALVATLLFQIFQFTENTKKTQDAAEVGQFREALQAFQSNQPFGGRSVVPAVQLTSFLNSPQYGQAAKQALVTYLPMVGSLGEFKSLYSRLFPNIRYSDLPDLVGVARNQLTILRDMLNQQESAKKQVDLSKKTPGAAAAMATAQAQVDKMEGELSLLDDALRIVTAGIASSLRQRPPAEQADLSHAELFAANLRAMDFGITDLTGTWLDYCDISDADLSQIHSFEGSVWSRAQWWRAKAIGPGLIRYLRTGYGFDAKLDYNGPKPTKEEYHRLVATFASSDESPRSTSSRPTSRRPH